MPAFARHSLGRWFFRKGFHHYCVSKNLLSNFIRQKSMLWFRHWSGHTNVKLSIIWHVELDQLTVHFAGGQSVPICQLLQIILNPPSSWPSPSTFLCFLKSQHSFSPVGHLLSMIRELINHGRGNYKITFGKHSETITILLGRAQRAEIRKGAIRDLISFK